MQVIFTSLNYWIVIFLLYQFARMLLHSASKFRRGDDGHLPGQGAKRKPIIPLRNFDAPTKKLPDYFLQHPGKLVGAGSAPAVAVDPGQNLDGLAGLHSF